MKLEEAQPIANRILSALFPFSEDGRCHIAGSVRRGKMEVKDIEIMFQPKIEFNYNLLNEPVNHHRNVIACLEIQKQGKLLSGNPNDGRYCKILLPEGINLDLFMPEPYDYYRMYAIRTGSADYSHKIIANAWLKKGWVGTDNGLRMANQCYQHITESGKKWICTASYPTYPPEWQSEEDFFQWLGIDYVEPINRNI